MPDFILEDEPAGFARIKVIGVGGGGSNAVDSMFDLGLQNVDFYIVNTDLQALKRAKCPNRIQIGAEATQGRGCGADPTMGEKCMMDARELLEETLQGADIVFITAGLGGGTGTGASPVVAQIAKEMGILTVSIVTKPFKFEGPRRMKSAIAGLEKIREHADTVVVINNERLLDVVGPKVPMKEAFAAADKVLSQAVASISDLVTTPGLINVDFNDIRTIMGGRGGAVMGVGMGKGESRATEAVKKATSSPLLDKVVIDGATGILICITGGADMTLAEVSEATDLVAQVADPDAEIIFGAVIDESLNDSMRVTLIATGFSDELHRRREIQKAMESAPVAPARPRVEAAAPAAPAPVAEAEQVELKPILNEQVEEIAEAAPVAAAPVAAGPPPPPRPTIRNQVSELQKANGNGTHAPEPVAEPAVRGGARILREDSAPAASTRTFTPPTTTTPGQPVIRVAPSRSGQTGELSRPSVRMASPAEAPAPVKVSQFTPSSDAATERDEELETPTFIRKRRSLFD